MPAGLVDTRPLTVSVRLAFSFLSAPDFEGILDTGLVELTAGFFSGFIALEPLSFASFFFMIELTV